jgi:hypothetical protein
VILAYATKADEKGYLCRSLRTAVAFSLPFIILGWGQEWIDMKQKMKAYLEYSENVENNTRRLNFDILRYRLFQS